VDKKKIGILAILGASLMWALEPIAAKLSYQNADFLQTSAIRAFCAALIALIYITLRRHGSLIRVTKQQIPPLLYLAIIGTLVADLIYFFALTTIPVVNAVLIGHMQPLFIILIGFFLLKEEKLTRYDYGGICAMILAGTLVATRTIENLTMFRFGTLGDALVIIATIAWATTAIAMKKYLGGLHAGIITFYRFIISALVFMLYLTATTQLAISNPYQILVGLIVGTGTLLYYEALHRIKAAQVSALELTTPFFAALLGYVILGEHITVLQLTGILALLFGILLLSRKEQSFPTSSSS
jgi:drug/metabolite transporter (DMT)-like permease